MREANIAFKKKLHETKLRQVRRLNLQWACGLTTLVAALMILTARYSVTARTPSAARRRLP